MIKRILFYSALTGGMYYSAVAPLWSIPCVVILDFLLVGMRYLFPSKPKEEEYEALISLGFKNNENKIKFFKKELKAKGFKVISCDSDFIKFKGTRDNFLKHQLSSVIRVSFVPGEQNFFSPQPSKTKKIKEFSSKFKKNKNSPLTLKNLKEGEVAWVCPWSIEVSSLTGDMYIDPSVTISSRKKEFCEVCVIKRNNLVNLNLTHMEDKTYTWLRVPYIPEYFLKVGKVTMNV